MLFLVAVVDLPVSAQSNEAPAQAAGDDAPSEAASSPSVATVYETATVRARSVDAATASVQVVSADEIERMAASDAADVLRLVPGMFVLGNDSSAAVAGASVRGGDANFTLVLIDGVPMADSTDQYGGAFPLGGVAASEIERLEVVRGPLSSFYGSSSLAGAVQLITASPRGEAPFLGWSAETGEDDRLSGRLSWGRAGASSTGSINAAFREEEGLVGDDAFAQQTVSARWSRGMGPASAIRLAARLADWETADYGDGSGGPVFGSGELRSSDHRDVGFAATFEFGAAGAWRHVLRSTLYEHDLDRDSPAIAPVSPPIAESTRFSDLRVAWTAVRAAAEASREWSVGVEGLAEEGRNRSLLLFPGAFGGPFAGDYLIERQRTGAFAEWRYRRGGLVAEVGARVDRFEGRGEELSPRVGLRWSEPSGRWSLRASAGEAFKLPSLYGLATPRAIGGNPALAPETSRGVDAGVEYSAAGGAGRAGLTLFSNRFENLIDFDFETFQIVNRRRAEIEGAEAFLRFEPGPRVGVDLQLTVQTTEDLATGRSLRRRPDVYGGVGVRIDLSEAVLLGLEARHVGSYLDEQVPAPLRTFVAARELVGVTLSWRTAERWRLSLRAENALDEAYETQVGFPGPERSVRLGVRYGG